MIEQGVPSAKIFELIRKGEEGETPLNTVNMLEAPSGSATPGVRLQAQSHSSIEDGRSAGAQIMKTGSMYLPLPRREAQMVQPRSTLNRPWKVKCWRQRYSLGRKPRPSGREGERKGSCRLRAEEASIKMESS